jgi:hypothetical protein
LESLLELCAEATTASQEQIMKTKNMGKSTTAGGVINEGRNNECYMELHIARMASPIKPADSGAFLLFKCISLASP